MTAPSSAVLHQWQTSTDQSSLGESSLVKPLFVHPAIKSSLRHAIKQILTRRAIETNYILWIWCVCLCFFLFGELACAFVQYTMHFTQHCCVCYSLVYFSAFDVSLCGFLKCLSVCLFPIAFVLLFFASSSLFSKCLSMFWFNLWYLPPSTAWGPWGHSRD